ncbi:MAG TPA: glycosyltransferase family 4 protein [Gemmataceae bacterium]|nr:glycosyltransferase family 4 protein [Gemmataceae bacterium]
MILPLTADPLADRAGESADPVHTSRPRLLFAAHSGSQGGGELCLDSLLRQLDRDKYQITVLFPWEGPMADSARRLGFDVVIRPLNWWMCWGFSWWDFKSHLFRTIPNIVWLARYIRRNRVDLVYTNSAVIFEAAVAARVAGVPHVWHVHEVLKRGNVTMPMLPIRLIKKLIGWLSRRIIFESNASRNVYENGRADPKCGVVYNCVRFPDGSATFDRGEARRRLGFGDEEQVVSFIGQLSERKNPLLLAGAAARIADHSKLRFLFVGDGPLLKELQDAIGRLNLHDCCRILPFQADVAWVLSATDVLVLPSRQESFGLVLVEAAALGKPAIATRTEGPSEIIVDGVTGFLVTPEDEGELAQKIIDIFGPHVDRQQMGQAAAERARDLFSAPKYARTIEEIIDNILATRIHVPSVETF